MLARKASGAEGFTEHLILTRTGKREWIKASICHPLGFLEEQPVATWDLGSLASKRCMPSFPRLSPDMPKARQTGNGKRLQQMA